MHLRDLRVDDTEGMLEWMKDPNINRYFQFDPEKVTPESVRDFILNAQSSPDHCHKAIADDQDIYMGTVSLKHINRRDKNAEYAVSLRACAAGKGAGSFATRAILHIAFNELELHKVYLNVLMDNSRAISLYEKTGFRKEGHFRDHLYLNGAYRDLCWYSIKRGEYLELYKP